MATYEATKVQQEHSLSKRQEEKPKSIEVQQPQPEPQQQIQSKSQPERPSQQVKPIQQIHSSKIKVEQKAETAVQQSPKNSNRKLQRRVSFTEKDPVIIGESNSNRPEVEPQKPRRKKDKEKVLLRRKKSDAKEAPQDRRRSHPVGDQLFEQVSTKLKALEQAQQRHEVTMRNREVSAFGDLNSSGCSASSSKEATSTEASPKQKQRNRNSFGIIPPFASAGVNLETR